MIDFLFSKKKPQLSLSDIQERLQQQLAEDHRDQLAHRVCELALSARQSGNYGVGALICRDHEILFEASNAVFEPTRNSAAHAEMLLLDLWEQAVAKGEYPPEATAQLTLVCSLEPCPMCLSRLLMSGIRRICYLVEDKPGGMVSRARDLPPAFRNLMQTCDCTVLRANPEYRNLAQQLANHGLGELRQRLIDPAL
ncbi:deaminase [Aestuariirhabdus sp. Z084]|uniref:deaminase n=1 Tax=Aestuariirhabdus haliotis TaxID=2918751 RepID=UPI00201B4015|nr:deaminase [Aestuariirhabdus haliotis]MCL6414657.1 deaminase [Aestuariirhabdus haliotis]MCL6418361.1 deaminase [Aestuariirhabdus haliotis]